MISHPRETAILFFSCGSAALFIHLFFSKPLFLRGQLYPVVHEYDMTLLFHTGSIPSASVSHRRPQAPVSSKDGTRCVCVCVPMPFNSCLRATSKSPSTSNKHINLWERVSGGIGFNWHILCVCFLNDCPLLFDFNPLITQRFDETRAWKEQGRVEPILSMAPEEAKSQPLVMVNVYTRGVLSGNPAILRHTGTSSAMFNAFAASRTGPFLPFPLWA